MVNWNYVIPIASMLIVLLKVCPSKAGASAFIPKLKLIPENSIYAPLVAGIKIVSELPYPDGSSVAS
jgi:hypothetical protein